MKILTICPSEFLPPYSERTRDHIYFVYDKMALYLGRDVYSDAFCVVEDIPDIPVEGMLYITFDGFVKARINEQVIIIAEIENRQQLDYLKVIYTMMKIHSLKSKSIMVRKQSLLKHQLIKQELNQKLKYLPKLIIY